MASFLPSFENKTQLGTTIKLTGPNYLLWSQVSKLFVRSHNKLSHLTDAFPNVKDATKANWQQDDYSIKTWLLNNMESTVSSNVMFLSIVKEMWDAISKMFSQDKNVLLG